MTDCSIFYENGKLLPMCVLPTWYVQFLSSSPPNKETRLEAKKELKNRREVDLASNFDNNWNKRA